MVIDIFSSVLRNGFVTVTVRICNENKKGEIMKGSLVLMLFASLCIFSVLPVQSSDVPSIDKFNTLNSQAYDVSDVIDGDTIAVTIDGAQVKVRLVGVDTPETVHPTKPVEAYGKEASSFLKNLLKGEKVYLQREESGQSADVYGRQLYYVYRAPDGLFVNAEIIRQGYGHAYTNYPFKYLNQFKQLEQFAREKQKGLWETGNTKTPGAKQASTPAPVTIPAQKNTDAEIKQTSKTTVYITKTGQKYHSDGCRYLSRSRIPVDLDVAIKSGYTPCSVCTPPTASAIDPPGQRAPPSTTTSTTQPSVAENGSHYGQISENTGKPKTTYVNGYYRKDGTYVRGHYRSK